MPLTCSYASNFYVLRRQLLVTEGINCKFLKHYKVYYKFLNIDVPIEKHFKLQGKKFPHIYIYRHTQKVRALCVCVYIYLFVSAQLYLSFF
jgi:hypothetical protein